MAMPSTQPRYELEHVPTVTLILNPRNARRHQQKQIKKIARSIQRFGFTAATVIDENNIVWIGNGRILAALELGLPTVPCIRLTGLSDAEKTALALADNKLGDESSFDDAMVKSLLTELVGVDFDVELTGFDPGEIDFRIDGAAGPVAGDPADQPLPPANTLMPVTRAGDLWKFGDKHRLFCGSALEAASYEILLKGELAQMIFTDSPWNVPIQGHVSGNGNIKHREFQQASGELSDEQFRDDFLRPAHRLMADNSVDGSIHFSCMDWRHTAALMAACEDIYSEVKNICVWIKQTGGLGSLYRSQHEFVVVFKKGSAKHINNIQLGKFGRYRTNCWDYPGANSFGPTRDADLAEHPTIKPLALVADAIKDCSNRGDLILVSDSKLSAAISTSCDAAGV